MDENYDNRCLTPLISFKINFNYIVMVSFYQGRNPHLQKENHRPPSAQFVFVNSYFHQTVKTDLNHFISYNTKYSYIQIISFGDRPFNSEKRGRIYSHEQEYFHRKHRYVFFNFMLFYLFFVIYHMRMFFL